MKSDGDGDGDAQIISCNKEKTCNPG
jgi:hypothetical protein